MSGENTSLIQYSAINVKELIYSEIIIFYPKIWSLCPRCEIHVIYIWDSRLITIDVEVQIC